MALVGLRTHWARTAHPQAQHAVVSHESAPNVFRVREACGWEGKYRGRRGEPPQEYRGFPQ